MNVIFNITVLAFPLIITIISWTLYGKKSPRMARFHLSMIEKRSTRKVYTHVLLFSLLIFHYLYSTIHFGDWGVLLSTLIIACMYRFSISEYILLLFNSNKNIFLFSATLTVIFATIPHLYTLSLTLAFILLASLFYPTKKMLKEYNSTMVYFWKYLSLKINFFAEMVNLYTSLKFRKTETKYIKPNNNFHTMTKGIKELFLYLNEKTEGRKTKIDAFCDLCDKASSGFISPSLRNPQKDLQPQQCNISLSGLANEWKWSRVAVRAFLKKLETYGQITIQKTAQSLILTMPITDSIHNSNTPKSHGFNSKLQATVAKWILCVLDDSEFLNIVTHLIDEQIPHIKESYEKYLLTKEESDDIQNSSSTSEDAQAFAVEYVNKIVIDELILATFIKALRSKSFGAGQSMDELLQVTCNKNWTEFLNNLMGLSQLILSHHSDIPKPSKNVEKLSQTYKAILANRLADIVYENAEN